MKPLLFLPTGSASKVVACDEEIVSHFLPPLGSTSGTVTVTSLNDPVRVVKVLR